MLTFANPLFLFALAGLAVPVIAHLINREKASPLKFPSLRFIKRSSLPREDKRSITDFLLLLLRCLFIAAIILLLAGPEWSDPVNDGVIDEEADVKAVFVIDKSSSMSGWNSWEMLEEEFSKQLELLPETAAVGLVMFGSKASDAIDLIKDHRIIEDIMSGTEPDFSRGNPVSAVVKAVSLLGDNGNRRLIIISDFQSNNWQASGWSGIDPGIDVELLRVGDFNKTNAAILSANAYPASEDRTRVIVRIKNFSKETLDTTVRVFTGDKEYEEDVQMSAGQTQRVSLLVPKTEQGIGRVVISDDAYNADNSYVLWMGAPPSLHFLTVVPIQQEPQKLKELEFLNRALSVNDESAFNRYSIYAGDVTVDMSRMKQNVDIVHLSGSVPYLANDQLVLLKEYLEGGGVVMVTPGKSAVKQFRTLRLSGIGQTTYVGHSGGVIDRRKSYHIGWINPESTLADLFDEDFSEDLYLTEIYQYLRLRPSGNAEVLLKTEEGDPILLREQIGEGILLTSAISFDTSWSDLPLRYSFLPMLRELFDNSVAVDSNIVRMACGEAIPATYLPENDPAALYERQSLMEMPDIFLLDNKIFQVNVSRDESLSQSVSLADVRTRIVGGSGMSNPTSVSEVKEAQAIIMWPYLLAGAFVFAVLEVLLTGIMDSRSRRT